MKQHYSYQPLQTNAIWGKFGAIFSKALLFLVLFGVGNCYPADWVEKGQIVPYSGILLTGDKAQRVIDTEELLLKTEEKVVQLEASIKDYEELGSLTTLRINNLDLQIKDLQQQNKTLRNNQGWNFLRYSIGYIAGMGTIYLWHQIAK